jgi:hypothetical protein
MECLDSPLAIFPSRWTTPVCLTSCSRLKTVAEFRWGAYHGPDIKTFGVGVSNIAAHSPTNGLSLREHFSNQRHFTPGVSSKRIPNPN